MNNYFYIALVTASNDPGAGTAFHEIQWKNLGIS